MARSLSIALTFDFDALSIGIGKFDSTGPGTLSRGEFGAYAIPRILDVLRKHGARGTFYTPGHTVYAYPDAMKAIVADGHEIAHHGWVHENPALFDRDGQRRNIERGLEAIDDVLGLRPVGYRAPAPQVPDNVELVAEMGFVYESNAGSKDYYPYYVRVGDVVSKTEPFVFGKLIDLVEVPFSYTLADFGFEYVFGRAPGFMPPSTVDEIWRGEFEFALGHCPEGIFSMTLHPEVIGRGHRLLALDRLLEHFRSHADVVFEPVGDYVVRWKGKNPREQWAIENPALAGAAWSGP